MQQISALFYLEPWTENKKPWFRHFPVRRVFNRLGRAIQEAGGHSTLLCGEGTHFTILEKGWGFDAYSELVVVPESGLRTIARSYSEFAHLDQTEPDKLAQHFASLHPDLLGRHYDLVFVWESASNFLKQVLDAQRVVYLSPGMLSREPYPYHLTVDLCGLFRDSWLARHTQQDLSSIHTAPLPRKKTFPVDIAINANQAFFQFREKNAVPLAIRRRLQTYAKNYCVPLQVSDYFATTNEVTGSKQWDFLITVLDAVPSDIGLVVTHYVSPGMDEHVILSDNINFLAHKYPNLIYSEELNALASVSQILLGLVDGVITVSSSVGLQAKMLGKELITVGASHLSPFSDGGLETIAATPHRPKGRAARYLKALHGRYFIPVDLVFQDQVMLARFIDTLLHTPEGELPHFFKDRELSAFYAQAAPKLTRAAMLSAKGPVASLLPHAQIVLDRLLSEQLKVVSFDVFDTLIQRDVFTPAAVFDLVEWRARRSPFAPAFKQMLRDAGCVNFRTLRMESEQLARKALAVLNFEDCNLDEIYAQIATHTDDPGLPEFLRASELAIELDVIHPRQHGKLLYELALTTGKQIIFVSDMYLPREQVQQLLEKCGIYGGENIYVSSEIRLRKHSGNLFLHVLQDLDISPLEMFHIGDAQHGDYRSPKNLGVTASLVPAARELWSQTYGRSYGKAGAETLTEEIIFGGQAMQVYDYPYHAADVPGYFRGRAEFFGYAVAGPLMVGLSDWLLSCIREKNIERMFFFARDGFIVQSVFEKTMQQHTTLRDIQYVHVSRRVLAIAAIVNWEDIRTLVQQRFEPMPLEELLRIRFGIDLWSLDLDEIADVLQGTLVESITQGVSTRADQADLFRIVHKLEGRILAHASVLRDKVQRYFASIGLDPDQPGAIGIFDIGYSASLQRHIEKIYGKNFIHGFYFATFVGIKDLREQGGHASAYAGENIDPRITKHQYVHAVHIFETLFSHIDGSTFNYQESATEVLPVRMAEQGCLEKNRFVSQLWQGIDQFLNTYQKYREFIDWTQFNWEKALKPFDDFVMQPAADDLYMLDRVSFENLYCGESSQAIIDFSTAGAAAIWKHGQRKVAEYSGMADGLRHLGHAYHYGSLGEYIHMLYEENFIKSILKKNSLRTQDLEEQIATLTMENDKLQQLAQLSETDSGELIEAAPAHGHALAERLLTGVERWFSEDDYIKANPDVASAVAAGRIESGWAHFKSFGYKEGRKLFA